MRKKMLKIKDNVDLKELEKYGYEKLHSSYVKYTKDTYRGYCIAITINIFSRIIAKCYCWTYMFAPIFHTEIMRNGKPVNVNKNYIQDLIQADLVEEVQDDCC